MLINHNREKLINAIIFFSDKTSFCGKIKLFKLLYFLDFEHYKLTGRSVTGMDYYAWKMGPVPVSLNDEFSLPATDLAEKIEIQTIVTQYGNPLNSINAKAPFDPSHFSKRELKLMEELADQYVFSKAEEMIEATHVPTLPWHKVYEEQKKPTALIPYEYAFSGEEDIISPLSVENDEIRRNYQ